MTAQINDTLGTVFMYRMHQIKLHIQKYGCVYSRFAWSLTLARDESIHKPLISG